MFDDRISLQVQMKMQNEVDSSIRDCCASCVALACSILTFFDRFCSFMNDADCVGDD